jgi:hypothetical protein
MIQKWEASQNFNEYTKLRVKVQGIVPQHGEVANSRLLAKELFHPRKVCRGNMSYRLREIQKSPLMKSTVHSTRTRLSTTRDCRAQIHAKISRNSPCLGVTVGSTAPCAPRRRTWYESATQGLSCRECSRPVSCREYGKEDVPTWSNLESKTAKYKISRAARSLLSQYNFMIFVSSTFSEDYKFLIQGPMVPFVSACVR